MAMFVYSGCFVPTKQAAKKENLETYTRVIEAPNKKVAAAILATQFYSDFPDAVDKYFDVKICGDHVKLSRPGLNQWSTNFCWNKEKAEIELINKEEPEEELIDMTKSSTGIRAALYALYGPLERVTRDQYSRVIDLTNDTEYSLARELAEAITRTPRILALLPERVTELLDETRNVMPDTAQWPDIKKFMDKWLDGSVEESKETKLKPAAIPEYIELTFEQRIAVAINAPSVQLDEVTPEVLTDAMSKRKCEYPAFIRAHKALTYLQPTLEKFSDRLLGEAIRSVNFSEEKGIVSYRRAVLDYLGMADVVEGYEDETEQSPESAAGILDNDGAAATDLAEGTVDAGKQTQEVTSGRSIFSVEELTAGPDPKVDDRPEMSDRQIEIAHAINNLFAGRSNIMDKEEAEGVISCTGHLISDVMPLLINDIESAECCLTPGFSDDDIHDVTTTILDNWSDIDAVRQELALNAIAGRRKAEEIPCKNTDLSTEKTVQDIEFVNQCVPNPRANECGLSYRQLIIIAAVQGLCANPAHATSTDDVPFMASVIADALAPTDKD